MVTKDCKYSKMCVFCVSDYHLEMILLPYIKDNIDKSEFIIFTENNLENTVKVLLDKLNLEDSAKRKIWSIGWNQKKIDEINKIECKENMNIVINGEYKFIKMVNQYLEKVIIGNINIIDCYHIGDTDVDIDKIREEYKCILNTKKI